MLKSEALEIGGQKFSPNEVEVTTILIEIFNLANKNQYQTPIYYPFPEA